MSDSISIPTGRCFPKGYMPNFFSVNINICFRLRVVRTRTIVVVDGCTGVSTTDGPKSLSPRTENGGCTNFDLKFNLVGNEYLCTNIGDYQSKVQRLIDSVKAKADQINQKEPIITKAIRKCSKNIGTVTCPIPEEHDITTTTTITTKATPYISQISYTSSTGTCRTDPIT